MAPIKEKAEKAEKLSPSQSADLVLNYLRSQNRPYSAADISANLKNRVTKTNTAKLLKDLHEKQRIEGRTAGKQIVYHVLQDPADAASPEELKTMEDEIARLEEDTATLRVKEKTIRLEMREDAAVVPLAEIKTITSDLETERTGLQERLGALREGNRKPLNPGEKEITDAELKRWDSCERSRKKIRDNLFNLLQDMLPEDSKLEDVKETLGMFD